MSTWTDERVDVLKKLWAEGHSANIIAARIPGTTRNSVIGKVHRLGLAGRRTQIRIAMRRAEKKRRAYRPESKPRLILDDRPPLPEIDTPKGPLVMFADLERHHCRASYGDPLKQGFGFCGCPIVPGTSYCEDHVRRYHQITAPRPRSKPVTRVNRILTRFPAVTTSEREDVFA